MVPIEIDVQAKTVRKQMDCIRVRASGATSLLKENIKTIRDETNNGLRTSRKPWRARTKNEQLNDGDQALFRLREILVSLKEHIVPFLKVFVMSFSKLAS